jgi:hypothetical protein
LLTLARVVRGAWVATGARREATETSGMVGVRGVNSGSHYKLVVFVYMISGKIRVRTTE